MNRAYIINVERIEKVKLYKIEASLTFIFSTVFSGNFCETWKAYMLSYATSKASFTAGSSYSIYVGKTTKLTNRGNNIYISTICS